MIEATHSRASAILPRALDSHLETVLRGLGHFIYFPNPGNLGDELIAVATVQVFKQLGLSYEMYDEKALYGDSYTIVYGGGGGMIPDWNFLPVIEKAILAPGVKRCVILPHSIRNCGDLLEKLDDRYTIFCRERESYEYCKRSKTSAEVYLADDMGVLLHMGTLPRLMELQWRTPRVGLLTRMVLALFASRFCRPRLLSRYYRKTCSRLSRHIIERTHLLADGRRLGLMMRCDSEAGQNRLPEFLEGLSNTDISRYGGSNCRWEHFNELGVRMFLDAIGGFDIVVTDRLHVSIAAAHLGVDVIMVDNNYGKLSGVWQQSLQNVPRCHMCRTAKEVNDALEKLGVKLPPVAIPRRKTSLYRKFILLRKKIKAHLYLRRHRQEIRRMWETTRKPESKPLALVEYELRELINSGRAFPVKKLIHDYFLFRLQYMGADVGAFVFRGEWMETANKLYSVSRRDITTLQDKNRTREILRQHGIPTTEMLGKLFADQGTLILRYPDGSMHALPDILMQGKRVFAKPVNGGHADSCYLFEAGPNSNEILCNGKISPVRTVASELEHTELLAENCVQQHPLIAELHPTSLNTIRMVTMRDFTGKSRYICGMLRVGRGGRCVDNLSRGGLGVGIYKDKGSLKSFAYSQNMFTAPYTHHPDTGIEFGSYRIPFWSEALSLVEEAHDKAFPRMHSVGWDVAITTNGPIIVEGNANYGGISIQLIDIPLRRVLLSFLQPAAALI